MTTTKKTNTKVAKLSSMQKAKIEMAMMSGHVVKVSNTYLKATLEYYLPAMNVQTEDLGEYIKNVLNVVYHQYNKEEDERQVVALCFNRIYDMPCITFVFNQGYVDDEVYSDDSNGEEIFYHNLDFGAHAFCYVLNLSSDWCSEFGYCYFKDCKRQG